MSKEERIVNPFVYNRKNLDTPNSFNSPYDERLIYSYWRRGLEMGQSNTSLSDISKNAVSIRDYSDVAEWFVRGVAWGTAIRRTEKIKKHGQEYFGQVLKEAGKVFESLTIK